ncbi:S-adenosyl-L-methionine-dependent methyltransferase [Sistotremastrum niveocremeum HHB9708]|uniref:S-adenosyl-L-methionine-dependent methyltransferase n=1 Tax=Sistotremastrum niveocremeum HHB9708 TaxID=1314777 RepID=A0A164W3V6_9AGAM|nr:S-adenosyl-L-methionine-dependent methyltransferase [Sistotremastrum niveocremeum HHB9708]
MSQQSDFPDDPTGSAEPDGYMLPANLRKEDHDRLNLQHEIWRTLLNGLCPVSKTELDDLLKPTAAVPIPAVLDVGCGSGIWCLDMAHAYPHAKVVGFDLTQCSPSFVQGSVLDGLGQFYGKFALVHWRTVLIHIAPDKQMWAIDELSEPGGLLIISDWDEIFVDEHRKRLPAAKDVPDDEAPSSWMARITNEIFKRDDPMDSILRFQIHNALQGNAVVDKESLRMSVYHIPVGWDGGDIENGETLGKMATIDFLDVSARFKLVFASRGVPANVIENWAHHLDSEIRGERQRIMSRPETEWRGTYSKEDMPESLFIDEIDHWYATAAAGWLHFSNPNRHRMNLARDESRLV